MILRGFAEQQLAAQTLRFRLGQDPRADGPAEPWARYGAAAGLFSRAEMKNCGTLTLKTPRFHAISMADISTCQSISIPYLLLRPGWLQGNQQIPSI